VIGLSFVMGVERLVGTNEAAGAWNRWAAGVFNVEKGETGPEGVLATDVRAVTHPAIVTADEQVNPGG
jgi:hypothetical protein